MRHKEMKDENIGTQDPEQFLSIVINQTEISKQDMSVQHKQPKKGPFSVFKCPNTKVKPIINQTSSMAFQVTLHSLPSRIIQTENIIQHIVASLRCWYQMEHLKKQE